MLLLHLVLGYFAGNPEGEGRQQGHGNMSPWKSEYSLGQKKEALTVNFQSSRLNFWDLESLLASNANLAQPRSDLSRGEGSTRVFVSVMISLAVEMVVPEGLDGLKCKMVVISM